MIEAAFLHNPNDKGMFCHCASILETHSGTLMVVWYTYPEDEYINATLTLAKKHKGGNTWSPGISILVNPKYSVGNPVLFQEPGGRIHLLYVALKGSYWNDAYLQEVWSDDEGQTWSNPIQLWNTPGMMIRHPPVLLDSGSYLLPAYDENTKQTILLSSKPPYSKWVIDYTFENTGLIQAAMVKDDSGKLTLCFRPTSDPRNISLSHSIDQGETWAEPKSTILPNPLSGVSTFSSNNNLVVVYNHTEEHKRSPLSVSRSQDGGNTWNKTWHLDEVPLEVSYPSFILGNNNIAHGVYTYNRRMIKYVKFGEDSFN
ncbi:MAG: hypothetical protein F3745_07870 [Nitrospinae bacterium]|nr:hypothetical protein [Nitrospinota bacterium]